MSHLLFADDNLLFCRANLNEWVSLNQILNCYEWASRQRLTREKTSLFFSNNTNQVTRDYIMQVAGLRASSNMEKYLGLPSLIGKSKVKAFQGIVEKGEQKD